MLLMIMTVSHVKDIPPSIEIPHRVEVGLVIPRAAISRSRVPSGPSSSLAQSSIVPERANVTKGLFADESRKCPAQALTHRFIPQIFTPH